MKPLYQLGFLRFLIFIFGFGDKAKINNTRDLISGSSGDDWFTEATFLGLRGYLFAPVHTYILGKGGDDVLIGGDRRDRLTGGRGDDYIMGGAGSDRLKGGHAHLDTSLGKDTFIYTTKNDGIDAIDDFQVGTGIDADVLHLTDLVDLYQYNNISDIIKFKELDVSSKKLGINLDNILDTVVEIGKDIDPNNYVTIWLMGQSGLD